MLCPRDLWKSGPIRLRAMAPLQQDTDKLLEGHVESEQWVKDIRRSLGKMRNAFVGPNWDPGAFLEGFDLYSSRSSIGSVGSTRNC